MKTLLKRSSSAILNAIAVLGLVVFVTACNTYSFPKPVPSTDLTQETPAYCNLAQAALPATTVMPSTPITGANADQASLFSRRGSGNAEESAWSPDQHSIAVAASYGVAIFDAQSLVLDRMIPHPSPLMHVAFSPDGSLIGSAAKDMTVRIWRIDDGTLVRTIPQSKEVQHLVFSQDGTLLHIEGGDSPLQSWDVLTGELRHDLKIPGAVWAATSGSSFYPDKFVNMSPDESTLVSTNDSYVSIWAVSDGSRMQMLDYKGGLLSNGTSFSADGTRLAVGYFTWNVVVWDTSNGHKLQEMSSSPSIVFRVAFSPRGDYIVSDGGPELDVWNVQTGQLSHTLRPERLQFTFSPDGTRLATASGGHLQTWQTSDWQLLTENQQGMEGAQQLSFNASDSLLLAQDARDTRIWSVSQGNTVCDLKTGIDAGVWLPNQAGLLLATSNSDYHITRLWRVGAGDPELRLRFVTPGNALAFSADGAQVVLATYDNRYLIYQTDKENSPKELQQRNFRDTAEFSANSKLIATYGNPWIRIWDIATQQPLRELYRASSPLVFSPDGSLLATSGDNRNALLWRVSDGKLLNDFRQYLNVVLALAFSPNGEVLAAGSADSTIRLWSTSDGRLLQTIRLHRGGVDSLAFSHDGTLLASSGRDSTIALWAIP